MVKNQRRKSSKTLNENEIYKLLQALGFCYADICYCPNKALGPLLELMATEKEKEILCKFGLPYKEKYLVLFAWNGEGFSNTCAHIIAQLHEEARLFLLSSPRENDNNYTN